MTRADDTTGIAGGGPGAASTLGPSPVPAFLLAVLLAAGSPATATEAVDLELALAVDVSGSIDEEEARLQRAGYLAALVNPRVIQAIQSGHLGRIAVVYYEWAGFGHNKIVAEWTVLHDEASARAFSATVAAAPIETARRTSVSGAIDFAVPLFAASAFVGRRRVLDISGDGENNYGRPVTLARDQAVAAGITINGLPIISERGRGFGGPSSPDLDLYFEECVIGGPSAFIVVARDFKDFAAAILKKLILEIAGGASPRRLARAPGPRLAPPLRRSLGAPAARPPLYRPAAERMAPPCDTGERRWRGFEGFR